MTVLQVAPQQDMYQGLVEDCQAILIERGTTERLTTIVKNYELGHTILTHPAYKEGSAFIGQLAQSLGKGRSTVFTAVQFAAKFPDWIESPDRDWFEQIERAVIALDPDKRLTWSAIKADYLPADPSKAPPSPIQALDRIYRQLTNVSVQTLEDWHRELDALGQLDQIEGLAASSQRVLAETERIRAWLASA